MIKLYGMTDVDSNPHFVNLEQLVSMVLEEGTNVVTLGFSDNTNIRVSGDYIHHLATVVEEIKLLPLGVAQAADVEDVNNTEYVDDTIDDLVDTSAVEVQGYNEVHQGLNEDLTPEQFADLEYVDGSVDEEIK